MYITVITVVVSNIERQGTEQNTFVLLKVSRGLQVWRYACISPALVFFAEIGDYSLPKSCYSVELAGKVSFVNCCMQTKLVGPYNGK